MARKRKKPGKCHLWKGCRLLSRTNLSQTPQLLYVDLKARATSRQGCATSLESLSVGINGREKLPVESFWQATGCFLEHSGCFDSIVQPRGASPNYMHYGRSLPWLRRFTTLTFYKIRENMGRKSEEWHLLYSSLGGRRVCRQMGRGHFNPKETTLYTTLCVAAFTHQILSHHPSLLCPL